ncbi:2OG-Fe(II) oxygenase [Sandaracinobacter sp. RS1-74]|uniref:2OG-Fe(II) oxygenase n=1 Tax=Sandaracinobacteroides sayramensis TaxID=2913411 RepID=UPI001EDA54C4|nr:2OG-Fe(II) oxygenase family protein [Sandaracinobacteroides sayramensis]MCG2842647.1 2OG-Fe(II) oxygenase [Sandaracinobacteroides sayramensis]
METLKLKINPALNLCALRETFQNRGRVRVTDFLDGDAPALLYRHLRQRQDWVHVVNSGSKLFELDRATLQSMSAQQREALDQAVYRGARAGFQYRYETIRVPDDPKVREQSVDPLARFAEWMSFGEGREFACEILGNESVHFADAQATAYAPGDFLTAHDDGVAGKNRLAAYVLGLTPGWRVEWGGLLLFHHGSGQIEGVAPELNTINLFAVPQQHSVSEVTRAAAYRRYSITGWLRTSG